MVNGKENDARNWWVQGKIKKGVMLGKVIKGINEHKFQGKKGMNGKESDARN